MNTLLNKIFDFDIKYQNELSDYFVFDELIPADINFITMTAWRKAVNLRFTIIENALYVIGLWNNKNILWGPPLANNLELKHIEIAFTLLDRLNDNNFSPEILYLWEEYPLYNQLLTSEKYCITLQAKEYIYDIQLISGMSGKNFSNKRYKYNFFKKNFNPTIIPYSDIHKDECIEFIENWRNNKISKIELSQIENINKFNIECDVCIAALKENLQMDGIVIQTGGKIQGLGLGAKHNKNCFNLMFFKNNIDLKGSGEYVFICLSQYLKEKYELFTFGEDWNIPHLAEHKLRWHPVKLLDTFTLIKKNNEEKNVGKIEL